MAVSNNNDCTISNLSQGSISILNAFNKSNSIKTVYEDQLTLFSTKEGKTVILSGEKKTVTLTGNYFTFEGNTLPGTLYDLLSVLPSSLFPVKNCVVNQQDDGYPEVTVSEKDQEKMVLAYQFYQKILAYPTSNLASNFTQALKGILTAKDPSQVDVEAVNAYFKNTELYSSVDFISVSTVMSYVNTYAFSWAGKQESYTYYVYVPESDQSATSAQPPKLVGKVVFTKKSSSEVIDPKDLNSGFEITYQDEEGKSSSLQYDQGRFYANSPSVVTLQPSFTTQSHFTNNPKDSKIIPILYGKVNGVSVLGTLTPQNVEGSVSESSWYAFWHPKSFQQWINLFVNLGGIAVGIQLLVQGVMAIYKKIEQKWGSHAVEESDLEKVRQELKALREQLQKTQDQVGETEIPDETEIGKSIKTGRVRLADQISFQEGLVQTDILTNQNNLLNEYAEIDGVSQQLEISSYEINQALETTETALDGFSSAETPEEATAAAESLNEAISSNSKTIPSLTETLDGLETQAASSLSAQAQANIAESNKALAEWKEYCETAKKMEEQAREGEGADEEGVDDWSLDV